MRILSVSKEIDPLTIGVVRGGYKIPPRCDKCGNYVIAQEMGGSLFFKCSCGNMGTVSDIEVTDEVLREVVEKRRLRKGR